MYEQSECKQVRVMLPLAQSEDNEYVALIPEGFTVDQFMELEPEFADLVLVHPRTHQPMTGDLYAQVLDRAVLYAVHEEDVSTGEIEMPVVLTGGGMKYYAI